MPFVAPIFAAVAAAVSTVVSVGAAVLAAASPLLATVAAFTGSGLLALGAVGLGALSMLGKSRSSLGKGAANPVSFKADVDAGVPYVIGRTGVGGNIIFANTSNDGHNKYLHYFIVLSLGPCLSIESFTANDTPVTFDSSGGVTTGQYEGFMWQKRVLGAAPEALLSAPPSSGSVPEWTSSHKLSGYCAVRWALEADNDVYPTGTPKPLWVVNGPRVYDPRKDSTYAGGSGPQRSTDPATWSFTGHDNPYLQAVTWLLGISNYGTRCLGCGIPQAGIDLAAFVTGANVAEANNWKVGGFVTSNDSKWEVLTAMLQAGGGVPVMNGGLISCVVNTPKVSIATLDGDDIVGDVSVAATQPRRDRINRILPRYRSEDHGWEMVTAEPVKVDSYITTDGAQRTRGMDFPLVQSAQQAGQLARYAIENSRELGPITLPLKPRWMGLRAGDAVTINEPELGLNSQLVQVISRDMDHGSMVVTLTCSSETTAKHISSLGTFGTAPTTPSLTGIDLRPATPTSSDWAVTGTTITANGVSQQAARVTGAVPSTVPGVTNVVVEYRDNGETEWKYFASPDNRTGEAITVLVDSVGSASAIDIAISYRGRGGLGDRLTLDNGGSGYTVGTFVGSGASDDVTPAAVNWGNISASGGNPTTGSNSSQTITSINVPIDLVVTASGTSGSATYYYVKNGAARVSFSSGGTITVNVGDTLAFEVDATAAGTVSGTLTVVNHTDADTTLDTFTYSVTATGDDVTLDAVGWADFSNSGTGGTVTATSSTQSLTGISTSITIQFALSTTGTGAIKYSKNGGAWTVFADTDTLSIANNDTLAFQATKSSGTGTFEADIGVYNQTDASAFVDAVIGSVTRS